MRESSWLIVTVVLLVGCASSPQPTFHSLVPEPGGVLQSAPLRIQVRRPTLPQELDTARIVRRPGPTALAFETGERWAAPLDVVVAQVLVEDLTQRLPNAAVYTEDGAIGVPPDVLVEIEFQRFGQAYDQSVRLEAQVALRQCGGSATANLERHSFVSQADVSDAATLVEELSSLLARLSDAVATRLSPLARSQSVLCRNGASPTEDRTPTL